MWFYGCKFTLYACVRIEILYNKSLQMFNGARWTILRILWMIFLLIVMYNPQFCGAHAYTPGTID